MKVLLAASEVAPIIKLGGLGDVVGSLPKALQKLDVNTDVIVPFFPIAKINEHIHKCFTMLVPFSGETYEVEVYNTKLPQSDVDVFLLKNDKFFSKGGLHAFANNISETQMFSFFSRSVVEFVKTEFNTYDIVHCNDWHTGLVTHLLTDELGTERPATLFTIHNLMYQGVGDAGVAVDVGIVPGMHKIVDWDIEDGDINLMQQGITSSDFINAVSPSYAKEILTIEFAGEFSDLLIAREGRLSGILNGIDSNAFPRYYDVSNWDSGKASAKKKLQEKLCLNIGKDKPLFSFISRLDPNQKGLDILHAVIPEIYSKGGQFVLLGTGDKVWEQKFSDLVNETNNKDLHIKIAFDNDLANEIYAASDFLLVPSRYEPCGLIQMIGMRYGALPIVHNVGGLKDSVSDGVNGYVFDAYSAESLLQAVSRGLNLYGKQEHSIMVQNAMKADFSWNTSAKEYKKLYERILETV